MILSGCASVTGSKMQTLSVATFDDNGEVECASCTIVNDKGTWRVPTTPGSIVIRKSYGDMVITCKKDGYKTGVATLVSTSNKGIWGNIILGGLVGYAVNASSGAGFNYPTDVHVKMGENITIPKKKK
jgi:hypothetical protein